MKITPNKKTMEQCSYEQLRSKNIEDNQAMLKNLLAELKDMPGAPIPAPARIKPGVVKKRFSEGGPVEVRRNPSRSARPSPMRSPPLTRSRRMSLSSVSSTSSASSSPSKDGRLFIKFGNFFKRKSDAASNSDDDLSDSDEESDKLPHVRRAPRYFREIRDAKDITEEEINMVAEHVCEKKYDSVYGTSCHQCRQKTDDMKTVCRNKECTGAKGQFCGPCLRNRYGEDVKEALKNPSWICPPCRGICNCSFCRKRSGKGCTGILIHLARESGFPDVNAYLQSFKR